MNYYKEVIRNYLTGSANKVIELIQNNPDIYQYIQIIMFTIKMFL